MEHFLQALLLGLVQGLTEFLPISSSAHIRLVALFFPHAAGKEFDPGAAFTAIIQLGTELAVLIYFWGDVKRIVVRWFLALFGRFDRRDPDVRMGWLVIIGTFPILIVGVLTQDLIATDFRSLWLLATVFVVFGVILGATDIYGRKVAGFEKLTWGHGILIGIAQVLALVPGVSRSGATTSAGLALGYTRPAAARFSFLLAIPAVFGSGLFEAYQAIHSHAHNPYSWADTGAATVVAFVVGFVVIAFFMNYISKRSFMPFVVYRILLGIVLFVLLGIGVIG
ncbi:undecaprenyl-diphosphatase [Frondihabitans sp. PAMC 28766]|uniref:undecaprenyl-diphosphate phosphatase n=1 Tax=Frondihabitans sp. PAMC 28766 TaxID=1795630 RepID=UPI00078B81C7|nr:undecaprenyl-diphosphate phosphatase [Frondihabitans sp. PAMC 28766]AMM20797.1 undecaprenyl-diphosphatase [Frondihabitans sp. PAMC 28766]